MEQLDTLLVVHNWHTKRENIEKKHALGKNNRLLGIEVKSKKKKKSVG